MIALQPVTPSPRENQVSSPDREPRELASPFQFGKDFRGIVEKDFSIRSLDADDVLEPEEVAVPKAEVSSATGLALSPSSESFEDLIPLPEDHTAPVEEGPSQLPNEELSLPASSKVTSPGASVPPVLATPIPTSSSPSEAP